MMTQEQLAEMEAADAALPKSLHNYNRAFADRRALLSHARASVERIEELREKLRRQAESHESIHLMLKSGIETITPQGWQAIASQCQKYAHEDRA